MKCFGYFKFAPSCPHTYLYIVISQQWGIGTIIKEPYPCYFNNERLSSSKGLLSGVEDKVGGLIEEAVTSLFKYRGGQNLVILRP